MQLFGIFGAIVGGILCEHDGFGIVDAKQKHRFLNLLAPAIHHRTQQQEAEQRNRKHPDDEKQPLDLHWICVAMFVPVQQEGIGRSDCQAQRDKP